MKSFRLFLLGTILTLGVGWLGNWLLYQYRYRVALKSFLAPTHQPYLLIGSSRLYHNIDVELLHDSVQLMAKPNLYGMDMAHILANLDLTQYRGIWLEYEPVNISGEKNQLIFWDPTLLFFSLSWSESLPDFLQTLGNTFLWKHLKPQFTGFNLPPRSLQWPMGTYPDLQRQAPWDVKKKIVQTGVRNAAAPTECPNAAFYKALAARIPKEIDITLVYPFGHPQPLSYCQVPEGISVWDLSQEPYSPHDLFDDRHLNPRGTQKMTKRFNALLRAKELNLSN